MSAIEDAVLKSHCAFPAQSPGHKCQGSVCISGQGVALSCSLCGPGEERSGPNPYTRAYKRAEAIVSAAGISWGALSAEAQLGAVRAAARERCPGCDRPAPEDPDKQGWWSCECGAYSRDHGGWSKAR